MSEEAGSEGEFGRLPEDDDYESGDDDGRVTDWEVGLPSEEDLAPLSQALVPPVLASAFSVKPEPARTALDVDRASRYTIANLRRASPSAAASAALRSFPALTPDESECVAAFEADVTVDQDASSGRTLRLGPVPEETETSTPQPNDLCDDASGRNAKRPRLAWTPQLHKRFVDVVAHLGIKNAVPKTIMQLMNVEGLTRENVASHLQKYRLYLKRMQGIPDEVPSPSDHQLFASVQPATLSHQQKHMLPPVPYTLPGMISMPIFSMPPPPCCRSCPIGMMPLPSLNYAGDGPCPSCCEQQHSDLAFKRG